MRNQISIALIAIIYKAYGQERFLQDDDIKTLEDKPGQQPGAQDLDWDSYSEAGVLGNTGGRIDNDDGVEQGDDGVAATNLDWDGFAENGMLGGGASAPTQDQDQGIGSTDDIDWSEFSSNQRGQAGDSDNVGAQDLDWDEFGENGVLGNGSGGTSAQDLDWDEFGENGVLGDTLKQPTDINGLCTDGTWQCFADEPPNDGRISTHEDGDDHKDHSHDHDEGVVSYHREDGLEDAIGAIMGEGALQNTMGITVFTAASLISIFALC